MKQTAVEWLIEELGEYVPIGIGGIELMTQKAKEMEKEQQNEFVYWLMENCQLISTEEEENVLWRYNSEEYSVEGIFKQFKKK